MNIADKFSLLTNYFSGSVNIRKQTASDVPEPTIDALFNVNGLFRKTYAHNIYIDSLYKTMKDRTIEGRIDSFDNNKTSSHWVYSYLNDTEKSINNLPEAIEGIIKKIQTFAEINNVDIEENLRGIHSILEEYRNDNNIKQELDNLNNKKNIIDEWKIAVADSVRKLESIGVSHFDRYDTSIDTNPQLISMKKFIDEKSVIFEKNRTNKEPHWFNSSIVQKYIDRINTEHTEAFLKIRNAGIPMLLADNFMMEKLNTTGIKDVATFLKDKIIEKSKEDYGIMAIMEFPNTRIKEIILFKDNSIVVKKNDNSYVDVFRRNELVDIKNEIFSDHIRNEFNKNPTVAKNFIDLARKDETLLFFNKLNVAVATYSDNLVFFNEKPFDIKNEFNESLTDYQNRSHRAMEDLDDKMHKKIKQHKVQQFAQSIASKKYRNLYNEESYNIIENIYDLKLKTDMFQDYIGKKIAAYKTPEEFNKGLMTFLDSFNSFNMEAMTTKVENAGATIISQSDDCLIVAINDYEQSKLLGSSSWCIVRAESYFDSYTGDGNQQYFIFDFTKDSDDNESMVGITLDRKGKYYAAHYKDDNEVEEDAEIISYTVDIVNELNYKNTVNRTARMNIS
jgi:hypothetical protein